MTVLKIPADWVDLKQTITAYTAQDELAVIDPRVTIPIESKRSCTKTHALIYALLVKGDRPTLLGVEKGKSCCDFCDGVGLFLIKNPRGF